MERVRVEIGYCFWGWGIDIGMLAGWESLVFGLEGWGSVGSQVKSLEQAASRM